jgi:hypothetical protein
MGNVEGGGVREERGFGKGGVGRRGICEERVCRRGIKEGYVEGGGLLNLRK